MAIHGSDKSSEAVDDCDMIVNGGHAVMLSVKISRELEEITKSWVSASNAVEDTGHHVTVAFIGRDLKRSVGEDVTSCVEQILEKIPRTIRLSGKFSMFGPENNRMVARVVQSRSLMFYREKLLHYLGAHYIRIMSGYNPHITLATANPGDSVKPPKSMPEADLVVSGVIVKLGSRIRTQYPLDIDGRL